MTITADMPNAMVSVDYDTQAYRIKALQSLASYRKTGLHVTHSELKNWLADLKNGQVKALPACHI